MNSAPPSKKLYIAFTDLEFTGLDPMRHEIIELGVIIADRDTLEEKDRFETKIKPEHIETADQNSLAFLGYKDFLWNDAISLKEAMSRYAHITEHSIFAAWNAPYDWCFLLEAFRKENIENPMGHHTIDIFTAAYEKLSGGIMRQSFKLSTLSEHLGIPKEPMPHRAINGAECCYLTYKKLRELP